MTDERFKKIYERNRNNMMSFCFEYYADIANEKNYKVVHKQDFLHLFEVWLSMCNIGDFIGGLERTVQTLKQKHNYGKSSE